MNDVQRIAEERAAQPRTKPIGSSMQSEHRIAKNAVVQQINALDGTRIQKIDAVDDRKQSDRKRSVVAYCRVSTDEIGQAVSIAMQVKAYREKINANPEWINKGIYVDDGFSGTNTEHQTSLVSVHPLPSTIGRREEPCPLLIICILWPLCLTPRWKEYSKEKRCTYISLNCRRV